jgi:NADPH-dependent 2,4-dienoyl-CoA reductase/sulfur reductase-like enzyme
MRDVIVIGGGAGGLAVAIESKKRGHDVLLIERENELGGILNQCIHNGFGLDVFKEEYTGPEYADRFIKTFNALKIDYLLDTTVIDLRKENHVFTVKCSNLQSGITEYNAKAVVLSTGSYERTRGQISIPGDRPYGVLTAGSAQRYLNIDGYMVGKKAFVLGSGDIGLIMARRMTLEGAEVLGVAEIMPYSNGLNRNIVQCLNDFDIPLYLSHTVTEIKSDEHHRLNEIIVSQVDESFQPIQGTEKSFKVDTLLLSIGLIPDITLLDKLGVEIDQKTKSVKVNQANETSLSGLFVCGNALQIHDLVDNVTKESQRTGQAVDLYLKNHQVKQASVEVHAGCHIAYITPQYLDTQNPMEVIVLSFRSNKKIEKALLTIKQNQKLIYSKKKMYLVPAEMETIQLTKKDIENQGDLLVELEVIS